MSSQVDNSEITSTIQQIKCWTETELYDNIENVLPVLISSLNATDFSKKESRQEVINILDVLLSNCVNVIEIHDVEQQIFSHALPKARSLLSETFADVTANIKSLDEAEYLLKQCTEIIKYVNQSLQFLLRINTLEINDVRSIPLNAASILSDTYSHCLQSQSNYGSSLEKLYDTLSLVFKSTQEFQNNLLSLMSDHFKFDLSYQEDLRLFTEVLQELFRAGEYLVTLDVRATALQWKSVSKLAEIHCDSLKTHITETNSILIVNPLNFLARLITKNVIEIVEAGNIDKTQSLRSIKVTSFFLQVIIKLSELYKNHINGSQEDILKMLLTIHRYPQPLLSYKQFPDNLISAMQTNLTVGAETLIVYLLEDVDFVTQYCKHDNENSNDDGLGYLLFSVSISKQLISSKSHIRQLWINETNNIIKSIFKTFSKCQAILGSPILYQGVTLRGRSPIQSGLYELIVTHLGGLILCCNCEQLQLVEEVLLTVIINTSNNVWGPLLASDLLCLIDRYGTSEMCYEHVKFFARSINNIPSHVQKTHSVFVNVCSILSRLYKLLTASYTKRLEDEFPIEENTSVYSAIGLHQLKNEGVTKTAIDSTVIAIDAFFKQKTVKSYVDMCDKLIFISSGSQNGCIIEMKHSLCVNKLMDLWKYVTVTKELSKRLNSSDCCVEGSQYINAFINILCRITSKMITQFDNSQMAIVLYNIIELCPYLNTFVKVSVCYLLKYLCYKEFNNDFDKDKCIDLSSNIFLILLSDENVIVKEVIFEVFDYFAHYTKHEEIVAKTVKNLKNQEEAAHFLQKKPAKRNGALNLDEYLAKQAATSYKHVCKSKKWEVYDVEIEKDLLSEFLSEDFFEAPSKKPKLCDNDELNVMINDIHAKTKLLTTQLGDSKLENNSRDKVEIIIKELERLL